MDDDKYIKELSNWLKIKESEGYPEEKLKQYLLSKGYKAEHIDKALSKISSNSSSKSLRMMRRKMAFFMPTFSKMVIMIFVALILMLSFFANKTYMPEYGAQNCEAINYQRDMSNTDRYAVQLNANPEILVSQLDDLKSRAASASTSYDPLWKALGVTYLYSSGLNRFNPLIPVPCPLGVQSFGEGDTCIDFFTAKNRSCVTPVKYVPVNPSQYFIHGLLLLLLIYLLLCIFYWLGNFFTDIAEHWIIIPGIILLALMLLIGLGLFNINYNPYIFFMLMFLALFTIEAFAEGIWKKVWVIIFILLILSFPFLSIFKDITVIDTSENSFHYCNETAIVDPASKISFFSKNNFGMLESSFANIITPVNACKSCFDDCTIKCSENGMELLRSYSFYGNKPSCVCTCKN